MSLNQSLVAAVERQVRAAALLAAALGVLSLVFGIRNWRERLYLDIETLVGLVHSVVILGLALGLTRHSRAAAFLLLVLAILGVPYTIWRGLPLSALLLQAIPIVFYARANLALRWLYNRAAAPGGNEVG